MDLVEIIKESILFPSKNLGVLAIYIVLSIMIAVFALGAMVSLMTVFFNFAIKFITGILYLVLSIILGFILSGYQISLIKSGINLDEKAPDFEWKKNLDTGIENLFISIIYYTLPTLIVLMVGCSMNIPRNIVLISQKTILEANNISIAGNFTASIVNTISPLLIYLVSSLIITFIVAIILFIITSILYTIAQARLANTDNVDEAANVPEAINDVKQIGIKKVIGLLVLILVIISAIEAFCSVIFSFAPYLSIISIIVTPYLLFFAQRSIGLMYSEIV